MEYGEATVRAVLTTLVRVTVDPRTPVLVRTRNPAQRERLAAFLAHVHGSARAVVSGGRGEGSLIEVSLPVRMWWPQHGLSADYDAGVPLDHTAPAGHLSR
jgi:hypothetical protein